VFVAIVGIWLSIGFVFFISRVRYCVYIQSVSKTILNDYISLLKYCTEKINIFHESLQFLQIFNVATVVFELIHIGTMKLLQLLKSPLYTTRDRSCSCWQPEPVSQFLASKIPRPLTMWLLTSGIWTIVKDVFVPPINWYILFETTYII